jgi:hypothetical protein
MPLEDGDLLPATHTARMLAMFEAVVGQFYLAVVVALFVGMYSSQSRGDPAWAAGAARAPVPRPDRREAGGPREAT